MSNRIAVATAGILAGAAMFLAAGNGVDIQGTYPKPGTYSGVANGISLCNQHGIKMPCPPSFTRGETKIVNKG